MAFSVMSDVPNPLFDLNGNPFSGAVLKAFLPGTTTNTSIFIDSSGSSPQATITYNAAGKLEVSGNEILPYIDKTHKWGIFANAADATANTPFYMGPFDNVVPTAEQITTQTSRLFKTKALMVADIALVLGDITEFAGYISADDGGGNMFEVVAAGTGTDDGGKFIDLPNTTPALQAKALFPGGIVNVRQFGAVGDGATDDTDAFLAASATLTNNSTLHIPDGDYFFTERGGQPTNFYSNSLIRFIGLSNVEIIFSKGALMTLSNQIGATDDITGSAIEIRGPGENIRVVAPNIRQVNTFADDGAGHMISIFGYPTQASFTSPVTFFDPGQGRNFTVGLLKNVSIIDATIDGGPQTGINIAGVDTGLIHNASISNTEKDAIAVNACRLVSVIDPRVSDNKDDAVSVNNFFDATTVAISGNGPYFRPALDSFSNELCQVRGLRDSTALGLGAAVRVLGSRRVIIDDVVTDGRADAFLTFSSLSSAGQGFNFLPCQDLTYSNFVATNCKITGGQINGANESGRREFFGVKVQNITAGLDSGASFCYQSAFARNITVDGFLSGGKDFNILDCQDFYIDDIQLRDCKYNMERTTLTRIGTVKMVVSGAGAAGDGIMDLDTCVDVTIDNVISEGAKGSGGLNMLNCTNIAVNDLDVVDPNRDNGTSVRAIFLTGCTVVTVRNFRVTTDGFLVDQVTNVQTSTNCQLLNGRYKHTGTVTAQPVTPSAPSGNIEIDLKWFHSALSLYETYTNDLPWQISVFGSPEGVRTAIVGATAYRRDGGALTTLYVKESGAGNTGWVVK